MGADAFGDALSIELPLSAGDIGVARAFVADVARSHDATDDSIEDLRLAVSEILAEAIDRCGPGRVRIAITWDGSALDSVVEARGEDAGRSATPETIADPYRRQLIGALAPEASFEQGDGWLVVRARFATTS